MATSPSSDPKMITNGVGWSRGFMGLMMGVVGGISSMIGLNEAGVLRPHPFTSLDANTMERSILSFVAQENNELRQSNRELREAHDKIRERLQALEVIVAKLPPEDFRRRLRDLELKVYRSSHDHDFEE